MEVCGTCGGFGTVYDVDPETHKSDEINCSSCKGTGMCWPRGNFKPGQVNGKKPMSYIDEAIKLSAQSDHFWNEYLKRCKK